MVDNDVWLKENIKSNGSSYYSDILSNTDDILIASLDPKNYMAQLQAEYYAKKESIKEPSI